MYQSLGYSRRSLWLRGVLPGRYRGLPERDRCHLAVALVKGNPARPRTDISKLPPQIRCYSIQGEPRCLEEATRILGLPPMTTTRLSMEECRRFSSPYRHPRQSEYTSHTCEHTITKTRIKCRSHLPDFIETGLPDAGSVPF